MGLSRFKNSLHQLHHAHNLVVFDNLFFLPAVGITLGGIGCILLAVGILLFLLAVWAGKSFLPFCIRSIVSIIRYPLRKAGIVK